MKSSTLSKRLLMLGLALGLCTVIVYLPALNLGFVNWDDDEYVYKNSNIHSPNIGFVRWAFTTFHCGNWHPLTWFSLVADRFVWGTGPMGFHTTNVVLHGINTALVTILAALLISIATKNASPEEEGGSLLDRNMLAAAVTGILFGFHPIHVESVAWISERKDVLSAFFFLAGILVYLRYAWVRSDGIAKEAFYQGRSGWLYFLTLLLFVLSLLSKPMAVTFPAVLLILDWYPLNRFQSGDRYSSVLAEKLPFFGLSLASSLVTIAAQKYGGAVAYFADSSLAGRILIGARAFVMYLWKMLVPVNLLPYYPYPRNMPLLSTEYLFVVLVAAGITVSCIVLYKMKRGRFWIVAWSYYLITLFPVLGIIQVGMQSMADRYTYLPSIGPFFLLGLGSTFLINKKGVLISKFWLRYSSLIVLGILAVTLSLLTQRQIGIWKDGLTFWNYVIEKEPGVIDVAYNNRGLIYLEQGRYHEALLDCNTALSINQGFAPFYFVRAEVYNRLGEYENTVKDLSTALTLSPDYILGYVYRSMMYNWLGEHDKALADLTTAVTIKPDYVLGYYHRGNTNLSLKRYDSAIVDFDKALDLDPKNSSVYVNRGTTYYRMNKFDEAIADFSKALSIVPGSPEGYFHRGKAYLKSGNLTQASLDFKTACRMGKQDACRAMQKLNR
jgi:tetratricopeptide (TPR) repeat protein/uncharacterized membrane protein (DUF441 family)